MLNTAKQLDMYAYTEKRKKYGDPNKNLAITGIIIVAIAVFVGVFLFKQEMSYITDKNIKFYPANTYFYVDVNLNNKNNNTQFLNDSAPQTAISFFDTTHKFINTPNNKKHLAETFGKSFSFGKWYENINNKDYEIKLLILPAKTSSRIFDFLSQLLDKNENFGSKVYRGYKISYFTSKKWFFISNRGNLYLSNNVVAIKHIIDNNIIHKSQGLQADFKIKNTLSMMQRSRVATVILNNTKKTLSKIDNANLNNILLIDFSSIPKSNEPVSTSVFSYKDGISIRSFTNVKLTLPSSNNKKN
ncbi:MAG: hypothetical protein WCK67_10755 [bacterium]